MLLENVSAPAERDLRACAMKGMMLEQACARKR
jgi:hypothetical protein